MTDSKTQHIERKDKRTVVISHPVTGRLIDDIIRIDRAMSRVGDSYTKGRMGLDTKQRLEREAHELESTLRSGAGKLEKDAPDTRRKPSRSRPARAGNKAKGAAKGASKPQAPKTNGAKKPTTANAGKTSTATAKPAKPADTPTAVPNIDDEVVVNN